MRNEAHLTPQFWGEEHQVPLSGVNLSHFKERKKNTLGKHGSFPLPSLLLSFPIYLVNSGVGGWWQCEAKEKREGRGSFLLRWFSSSKKRKMTGRRTWTASLEYSVCFRSTAQKSQTHPSESEAGTRTS